MRLARIGVKGLTVYDDPQELQLDLLPEGVVAIVGKNGSGKTSLLECIPAAIWGKLPSRAKRKSVYDYANDRDAYIELDFVDAGREIRVRLMIDNVARKSERLLYLDGVAVEPKEVAGKLQELFGSPELFLASVFAAQSKRGRLSELPKADRKALFVEMLGAERLQVLSDAAGKRGDGSASALEVTERDLAGQREGLSYLGDPEKAEGETRDLIRRETDLLEAAERNLEKTKTSRAAAIARRDVLEASAAPGQEIEGALALWDSAQALAATARQRDADRRVASKKRLEKARVDMAREPAIKDAKIELQAIEEAEAGDREASASIEAAKEEWITAAGLASKADHDLELAEGRLKADTLQAEGIGVAPCSPTDLWTDERTKANKIDLRGTCPLLQGARAAGERLEGRTAEVATLKEDAATARAEEGRRLETVRGLKKARVVLDPQRDKKRRDASALAGLAGGLDAAKREIEGVDLEKAAADEALARDIKEALATAPDRPRKELEGALEEMRTSAQAEAQEVAAIDFDELEAAEGRLQGDVRAVRNQLERLQRQLGKDQADGAEATKKKARISELEAGALGQRAQLEDWRLLQGALGRNGAQALLVDAAGPEVSELSNRILEACYSSRFQVEIRTLRPKKKGGFQEDFSITVYDEGAQRELEDLSGGERAVVDEALGMALGVYNAQRSGVAWETLFRDECASPLDGDNRPRYVAMLRRAQELGGFAQVPFVAHDAALWESADAQVWITAGTITVGPPA